MQCTLSPSLDTVGGKEPKPMDMNVMILFASVICAMTALCFMELRRIRKKMEAKPEIKLESK
jgi:hypothetical protein